VFDPKLLAKQAAVDFLEHKTPLNDSIRKIASDNNLNPNQVTRVVEEANILTYKNLFEKNAEKTFTFDLANSKEIISKLASGPQKLKDASVKTAAKIFRSLDAYDFNMEKKAAKVSLVQAAGISMEKTAEDVSSRKEMQAIRTQVIS